MKFSQGMAVVHNKELFLGWYLITLKLRETVESQHPKKSTYAGKIVPHYETRPPKSEWVISIEGKLEQGRQDNVPGLWAKLSIYRIQRYLKIGEDKDWVPQIVSLGPYHHRDKHLRHMERHKWRCLHLILERSGQDIGLYLDSVKQVEQRARACYEGRISMSCDKFVEMMVLDGCFVIEMFQGFAKGFEKLGYPSDDPIFSKQRGSILQIQRDMIMLENQIPLFILDLLLGLQLGNPNQKNRVANLAIQFFDPLMPIHNPEGFDPLCDHGMVHCLEVLRRSLMWRGPKWPKTKFSKVPQRFTRCLTKLRQAGIRIKIADEHARLGDIMFKDGTLWIPRLKIHKWTRSLFLNLIAFEQSHFARSTYITPSHPSLKQSNFACSNYITSYVIFMNELIKYPEDVQYLCNRSIINHYLENDAQVTELFYWVRQEVALHVKGSYLQDVSRDLDTYYSRVLAFDCRLDTCYDWITMFLPQHLWGVVRDFLARSWNFGVANVESMYFYKPCPIISLIAAFFLLVLTYMQTLYTVSAYYRQRS